MALIQSSFATAASGATVTGTMTSAPLSGSLVVAFPLCFQTVIPTLSSVSDTQGNSYTLIQGPISNNSDQTWLSYCPSAGGGGSGIQITATWSASVSFPLIGWAEFTGYRALDASGNATGTTATASASCTSTVAADLVIGWINNLASGMTAGSTVLFNNNSGFDIAQYAIAGAPGVQTSSCTGATTWTAIIAAFKPFSGGGVAGSLTGAYNFWGGGFS